MHSIPEKTLEHWASIYLSSRFPNGAMWWPTSGEDVLAELPRLAASGLGKTLALELKTTEATGSNHALWIDTRQLDRYLNPPFGPPLPVYYVFPVPHWNGPLRAPPGTTPTAPPQMTVAPPEWWRRVGWPWFGDWLYVMSAQSLGKALLPTWAAPSRARARLFTLSTPHTVGRMPDWTSLFARTPPAAPMGWAPFWAAVTRCGPGDGVRWRTIAGEGNQPDRVLVLSGDEERVWQFDQLPGRLRRELEPLAADEGGNERVVLHVPESALI
ncbi:hypothetical protein [Amycolatopsis balhimycina]|uniref:hypothetical protein n=1 Tax=Amycolatopsis balhimycina TaxID=208443 RepID=UPI000F79BBB4|nr:hypothetical protein [Amycolatopsis balhimycina]